MINRRAVLAALAALIVVVLAMPGRVGADVSPSGAQNFIEDLAEKATKQLATKDITSEERARRFRALFAANFDVPTIGRWVLGKYWRSASAEQRRQYMKLFEDMIVDRYAEQFTELSVDVFKVTKALAKGKKDIIVRSELFRPKQDSTVKLDWRLRVREGAFKVIDVMIEGVSMGQTQRSEFASVIRNNGGSVDGLLQELRKRTTKKDA